MMKTFKVRDNSGGQTEILRLKKGDKVKAKKTVKGLNDFGFSGLTYECTEIIKDKIYTIFYTKFSFYDVPAVLSETNCVFWAEPDIFEPIEER